LENYKPPQTGLEGRDKKEISKRFSYGLGFSVVRTKNICKSIILMQVTPVKNQSQVNPSLTLLPLDFARLILGDSGTFW
jgi:hypothetical protein